ncbi:PLD nuclease N-terminal domain-containing protein [Pseudalkalibacillus berkeleyi]|uniref:PLD nuclease N-terminal domain-containing protein n=1 Tax=Pseudalkalibacillus berkeleyi TaxID=1069813 RepID=A0ABS9H0K0_9BACL|nr:PLD nuclease N-terminal domain-containing protein [Pseudalkalibacillus berkeleyi]MCF6137317.1 PLD nuclease N-terminal domain-containing protein [Pseudalkalibacillus berkeleyi]
MEEMFQMMRWDLILPIILIELVLIIVALVDLIRNKETNGPRWLWVILILFIQVFGPILYFLFGRKH